MDGVAKGSVSVETLTSDLAASRIRIEGGAFSMLCLLTGIVDCSRSPCVDAVRRRRQPRQLRSSFRARSAGDCFRLFRPVVNEPSSDDCFIVWKVYEPAIEGKQQTAHSYMDLAAEPVVVEANVCIKVPSPIFRSSASPVVSGVSVVDVCVFRNRPCRARQVS